MLLMQHNQRRTELHRQICLISARTGITHTPTFMWDDAWAQAQDSVCEVHIPPI
jgi:hypothetical protein